MQSFGACVDVSLNILLIKQAKDRLFKTQWRSFYGLKLIEQLHSMNSTSETHG